MISLIAGLLARNGALITESVSAAVAIISGSFLLYNLARDIRSRVSRAFSALLFFVTVTYIGDLGVSYAGQLATAALWLRFQWIGIAFAPAAYFHLSDAILTMTGAASRGRRRWAARGLYLLASAFLLMAIWTDWLVRDPVPSPAPHFQAGPAFGVFVAYFAASLALSVWFVIRARGRALTELSRRRFAYLLIPYLTPALAIFPFLLVVGQGRVAPALFYAILVVFNGIVAIMLAFMAYPLAFFGSLQPDRQVKAQMLQFFLRGPVTAIAALAVIVWVPEASAVLGLRGESVMPLLAVTTILALQWAITLARPTLDRFLIYADDHAEIRRIQDVEARLLTGADFRQLLNSILAILCDYLRAPTAFVASITADGPRMEQAVGLHPEHRSALEQSNPLDDEALPRREDVTAEGEVLLWRGFWLIPLRANHSPETPRRLVGVLGVAAPVKRGETLEDEQWRALMALADRCAEALEDRRVQAEVFATLEGILPEISAMQRLRGVARYGGVEALTALPDEPQESAFAVKIKDALTHYWGGPNLTDDSLMGLAVARRALAENDGNPQRAMRAVLQKAIESLRPEGQRSMTTAEWILYNILELRFIQGRKVRDVAMRLAMSESDLYRKQRVAIEAVAEIVMDMERSADIAQGA